MLYRLKVFYSEFTKFKKRIFFESLFNRSISILIYTTLLILINLVAVKLAELYFNKPDYHDFVLIRRYSNFLILFYSFGQNSILRRDIIWKKYDLDSVAFYGIFFTRVLLSYLLIFVSTIFVFIFLGINSVSFSILLMSLFLVNQIFYTVYFRIQECYKGLSFLLFLSYSFFFILFIIYREYYFPLLLICFIQLVLLVIFFIWKIKLVALYNQLSINIKNSFNDIKRGVIRSIGDVVSESSVVLMVFLASVQLGKEYAANLTILLMITQLINTLIQPLSMKLVDKNIGSGQKIVLSRKLFLIISLIFSLLFILFIFAKPFYFSFFSLRISKLNTYTYYYVFLFSLAYSLSILMKNLLDSCSNEDKSLIHFYRIYPFLFLSLFLSFLFNVNLVLSFIVYHLIVLWILINEYKKYNR